MIRSLTPEDEAFVHDSWRKSYASSEWAKSAYAAPYHETQPRIVAELLASSVVLVNEAADGLIDGWACGWPGSTLHYVFVRQSARGRGVARALLDALSLRAGSPVTYTHRAELVSRKRVPAAWRYSKAALMLRGETMANRAVKTIYFVDPTAVPAHNKLGQREVRSYFVEAHGVRVEYDPAERDFLVYDVKEGKTLEVHRVPRERAQRWTEYAAGEAPWLAKPAPKTETAKA